MFTFYPSCKISSQEVDSTIQSFLNDNDDNTYFKHFYFKKNIEKEESIPESGAEYIYFDDLINTFPFLSSDCTNGFLVIKSTLDLFNEEILEFLIEESDRLTFESKELENNWRVIIANNLPFVYYQILDSSFRRIIIGFTSKSSESASLLPLAYYPASLLEEVIFPFIDYTQEELIKKIKEYLDIQGVEYTDA